MANPLYKQIGGEQPQAQQPNDGGFGAMMQQFQRFCQQYKGNPSAEIVKSGKVTQAQVDQARQMASQMMRLMPHK